MLSNQMNEINKNKHKLLQIANTFIDQIVIDEIDQAMLCCVLCIHFVKKNEIETFNFVQISMKVKN